jgi:putative ABC transport system permease protein
MKGLLSDAKNAIRALRREPVFAATVILTVALGIGANTAIFTVVNAALLRPLPYERPTELVMINEVDREGKSGIPNREYAVAPANYAAWREETQAFTDIAAVNYWLPTLGGEGRAEHLSGAAITPNTFDVLGVTPMLGSGFAAEHGLPGNDRLVILSYGLWNRRFGGDHGIVGRTIKLNRTSYTVLGVMPESYRHPELQLLTPTQIFRPIGWTNAASVHSRSLRGIARLRSGVSLEAGRRDIEAVARRLEVEFPETNRGWGVVVRPLHEELFGGVRGPLLVLLGGAVFVLLIVCANVANLVLARGHGRRREFAVRTSLGAGRTRLARQLVAESLVLTLVGGVIGLLAVKLGMGFLLAIQSQYMSGVADIRVDSAVVAFTIALALATGIVFGLLPVLQSSRADLRSVLNEDSARAGVSGRARRFRSGLVVAEVVLATSLAVGAGLVTRSFVTLVNVSTGFDTERVHTFSLTVPPRYDSSDRIAAYHDQLLDRIAALPGVRNAALVSDPPFGTEDRFQWISLQGDPRTDEDRAAVEHRRVGPGYFRTMGIDFFAGRDFRPEDGRGGDEVPVIVNDRMAARYWPNQEVLGQRFQVEDFTRPARVIGVVAGILDDGLDSEAEPRFYEPFFNRPSRGTTVVLRADFEPTGLAAAVRREAAALESDVSVTRFRGMDELVSASVAGERIALTLAAVFSLLALALAAVGIYGVMSYTVGQRWRELGIRSALGAQRSDIMRLVLASSGRLTVMGTIGGLVLALPLARLLSGFLFGVQPADPFTFSVVPLVLVAVGFASSYAPATRATRVSPAEALRQER